MRIPRGYEKWMAVLVFAVATALTCANSAKAQSLRWKFDVGNQYKIRIEQSTSLETEVDLVKQTIDTSSNLDSTWSVLSVDESGTAEVKMVIDAVHLKVTMPVTSGLRTLDVNTSAEPPSNASDQEVDALKNLQAIIGREVKITVTPRGEVTGVEVDAATKEALRQAPQSMQIRQLLTEEGLREMFASGVPQLPESDIQSGAKWTNTKDFSNAAGRFRREQSLHWVGRETHENVPQERIDLTANLTLLGPVDSVPEESVDSVKSQIKSQETTGTIWFDAERGMVTEGNVRSSLVTESPYREKKIIVEVKSQVALTIRRIP